MPLGGMLFYLHFLKPGKWASRIYKLFQLHYFTPWYHWNSIVGIFECQAETAINNVILATSDIIKMLLQKN